jgi:hypothetical protein
MTKARIDWMEAGRVKFSDDSFVFVQRRSGYYINSSGVPTGTTTNGAHLTEYTLSYTGKSYSFTYYNQQSTTSYDIGYYDADGVFLGGVHSNGSKAYRTATYTPPAGTVTVLVYGIYRAGQTQFNKYSSMKTTEAVGVFDAEEIRVRAEGDAQSQIVWPLVDTYEITSSTLYFYDGVVVSGAQVLRASGTSYAYAVGTVVKRRGSTIVATYTSVDLTPIRIVNQVRDTIDGEQMDRFHITTRGVLKVVTGNNLGKTPVPGGFGTDVVFTYQGLVDTTIFIGQQGNTANTSGYVDQATLGYQLEASATEMAQGGGTATVTGYLRQTRTQRYLWTSGSYSYDSPEVYYTAAMSNATIDSHGASAATLVALANGQAQISFPSNPNADENTYTVTGTYGNYSANVNIIVKGTETGRTYSNLRVHSYTYPVTGSGSSQYSIPAGGGGVYPTIVIKLDCAITGVGSGTLTGNVANGDNICTVSGTIGGQSVSTTVAIEWHNSNNGYVSAPSRGINVDSGRTLVQSNVYFRATKSGVTAAQSSAISIYQQQNQRWISQQGSFTLQSFTITPFVGNTALTWDSVNSRFELDNAGEVSVYVETRVTGSGTTTEYTYTALKADGVTHEKSGGTPINLDNDPVVPDTLNVALNGNNVTVTNQRFTADNRHLLNPKDYIITASYESSGNVSRTVRQKADEKVDSDTPVYYVTLDEVPGTNTLSAAGGEVKMQATAYHTLGKVWESDGYPAEEGATPIYDLDKIAMVEVQNIGYQRSVDSQTEQFIVYKYAHRDMKNYVTTDPLRVYAEIPGKKDTSANPLVYSVSNQLITSQTYSVYGTVTYGPEYAEAHDYTVSFAIDRYSSSSDPAPFQGATTTYRYNAYHLESIYHDGTQPVYQYQHYSSWTAAHDDDEHRELIGVTEDTETYRHRYVGIRSVSGDGVEVTKRHPTDTWATLNTTNHTITIAAQVDSVNGTPPRWTGFDAVNTSDPAYGDGNPDTEPASANKSVYQQAYQKLTASENSKTWEWDGTQAWIIDINAWYVEFKVTTAGNWISVMISLDGGVTWSAVDPTTNYGNAGGSTHPKLRIAPLSVNDPTFNPSGYQSMRLAQVNLVPQNTSGVGSVYISASQEEYDGGLSNE